MPTAPPSRPPTTYLDDEDLSVKCCTPITSLVAPVEVGNIGFESSSSPAKTNDDSNEKETALTIDRSGRAGTSAFFAWPLLGPLLFENETSDARDHCANERTFLSYLRLSVFMAILSVAITLSFHINSKPTDLERRISKPLGAIFWVFSVVMLGLGLANYIKTVNKYSKKAAIVQTGWRTQLILGTLAFCIIGSSIVLLVTTRIRHQGGG
ncbi:DUF domain-containing protein, partial [Metarhizium brunneum ARSEF 3297]